MAQLTAGQVYAYAKAAGFSASEAVVMTAIARAESGWNSTAVGDTTLANATWGPSIGLWQVRSLKAQSGTGGTRDATRLTDPAFNAKSAYSIYKGQGLTAWSVYSSGAYKKFLGDAQGGAVASSGVTLPSTGSSSGAGGSAVSVGNAGLWDDVTGGLGNAAGDAFSAGLNGVWSQVRPFIVTGAAATLGLALLGAGILVTAWPTTRTSIPSSLGGAG